MNPLNNRGVLKEKIFSLQDEIANRLSIDNDVDKILDNSTIFDEWEDIIPDQEFGIFVIAVLNNIRSDKIINKILDSILNIVDSKDKSTNALAENDQHPFC